MPQDPHLYGQPPPKKQRKEIPLSSSLTFASQLSSLIATPSTAPPSSSSSSGRARPSKTKDDIFSVKAKRKAGSSKPADPEAETKLTLRDVTTTEEEKQAFRQTKRKMEEKARLYAAMKRGDYVPAENESAPLVDFDRKWAEKHPDAGGGADSSSGEDNESDDDEAYRGAGSSMQEMVEFQDEFGRTRRGTRAEMVRLQRSQARSALGAAELEKMAAKPPKPPAGVRYGDAIQDAAFAPGEEARERMEELAARRDREPTPPDDTHYDGNAEIRTKGVGFYHFSHDREARQREMDGLAHEREATERARRDREQAREDRRREIEERRRRLGEKRAEKMASRFLDGLAGEMKVEEGGDSGGGNEKETVTHEDDSKGLQEASEGPEAPEVPDTQEEGS